MKTFSFVLVLAALAITSIAQGDVVTIAAVDALQPVVETVVSWALGTLSPGSCALLGAAALVGVRRRR